MPKITPLPYQLECMDEIDDHGGRALLALEMGTGKTLTALWWAARTIPADKTIVVVCPASLKYMWQHEARHAGMTGYILEGRRPELPSRVTHPRLVIINYDILADWVDTLRQLRPALVVLDECPAVKSSRAKRTKAVRKLCRGRKRLLALSGTPLLNRPAELWTTLNLLRPDVKEFKSMRVFGHKFCRPRFTPWGVTYTGASRLGELNLLLKRTCMIRRLKADVLKDLPAKIRRVVPMDLSDRAEYEFARDNFLQWLGRISPAKMKSAQRAVALARMSYLTQLCARLSLRAKVRWINRYLAEQDGKLLIATVHHKMTDALVRRCNAPSVVIDGRTPVNDRRYAVQRFQRDKGTRLFIGNIQAAGVGLTLTAASNVVFTELPWRPADCTQFEDRAHRIGQDEKTWIWYLVAGDTVEEKLCEVLQTKQGVVSATLDGGGRADDLDVFNQLVEYLREGK